MLGATAPVVQLKVQRLEAGTRLNTGHQAVTLGMFGPASLRVRYPGTRLARPRNSRPSSSCGWSAVALTVIPPVALLVADGQLRLLVLRDDAE